MGSGEPALVPEWLRAGKSGKIPNASSYDDGVGVLSRNMLPLIPCDRDSSTRNSCIGSEAYSNFGRRRDGMKRNDHRNPVTVSRTDSDRPWRNNHGGVLGRHGELWPEKPKSDSTTAVLHSENMSSGGITRPSTFKTDFPKLPSVENIGLPTSAGERRTSALAQVNVVVGVNADNSVLFSRNNSTGLNMAESLIHASSRPPTAPQLAIDTARAEELTLRQCMQLIPVTPSMPKTSGLNSSEKPKFRGAAMNGHYGPPMNTQQLSSQLLAVNNSPRASAARSDALKASPIGNFQVLCREKTVVISAISANDAGAQDVILKSTINPNLKAESKGSKSMLSSSKSCLGSFEEKKTQSLAQNRSDFFNSLRKKTSVNHSIAAVVPEPSCCVTVEKSFLLEQNSGTCADIAVIDPIEDRGNGYCTDASVMNQEGDCADGTSADASVVNQAENAGDSEASCEDGADASSVEKLLDRSSEDVVENDQSSRCSECNCHLMIDLDERERAFLRSLGWEEDAPEEALTEEEIAAFIKQYQKVRPLSQVLQSLRSC